MNFGFRIAKRIKEINFFYPFSISSQLMLHMVSKPNHLKRSDKCRSEKPDFMMRIPIC